MNLKELKEKKITELAAIAKELASKALRHAQAGSDLRRPQCHCGEERRHFR